MKLTSKEIASVEYATKMWGAQAGEDLKKLIELTKAAEKAVA